MRFDARRALIGLVVVGAAGAILLPPAVYFVGLVIAPRPVPSASHVPPPFADALWARFNGGRATELRPLSPISLGHFMGCFALADLTGDGVSPEDTGACDEVLPAIEGAGQLSRAFLRDENFPAGNIKYPFGQIATMAWVTRNWTRTELVDSLAERGRFGFGLHGAEAAARYYFDRPVADLSVPQAALLASFGIGEKDVNPWGEPELATKMRNRVLAKMHNSRMIDAAAYESASRSELALGPERFSPPPRD